MAIISIDFLAGDTFSRLAGVRAIIDHADKSIPEMELKAQETLKSKAEHEHWEWDDYDVERQLLETSYQHWIPKYTAYSAIILICSIVETQLAACAERIGKEKASPFKVRDLKGSPIESSILFIRNLTAVNPTNDPAWPLLRDMQKIRNIIVHRGGGRGETHEHQKEFDELLARHCKNISQEPNLWGGQELWVSMRLCDKFVSQANGFFRRLFPKLGIAE